MSTRVPAWKRLGLKLKGSADESPAASSDAQTPQQPNATSSSPASALKRKIATNGFDQTPYKKSRTDDRAGSESALRRQKSVTFTEDTANGTPVEKKPPKKERKPKQPSDAATSKPAFTLEPALAYLRQWHTAREAWKFNKNNQTLLIKYFFDGDKVPSPDTPAFYEYVRDIKGFVRTRLRETATEIRKKDMEDGAAAFPASTKDKETKQKEYEDVISRFLAERQQSEASSANVNGKRSFDDVELVLRTADPEIKQRLLKRIRAELVLENLSDSEDTTSTETTTTTCSGSVSSSAASKAAAAASKSSPEKAAKQGETSQQPAKRRRLRNARTAAVDVDSSSDDSDSSDSNSSSSDDDDESEDEDMETIPNGNAAETSSSSSSSSSESDSEPVATGEESGSDDDSSDDDED
ncbi:hypothetical protein B0H63DRAFT_222590 [Podospora didyma]|uniref:WKF domain-containing protein n=1 Tax=Podospora didyma TaxID=330526 RepID=A0AAE0KJ18_9PEZI|nr:hypothetical protein B0H63DRAFT_222590 [Podospora didyma]